MDHNEAILGTDPLVEDTDGDGANDLDDMFPNNGDFILDLDGDPVEGSEDKFPGDPRAYKDDDGDGYPDEFFPGYVRTLDGKRLDQFLGDGSEHTDSDGDGVGDNADLYPQDEARD